MNLSSILKIFRVGKFLLLISSLLFLINCSTDVEPGPSLPPFQEEVVAYFKEVALGFENGGASEITRFWTGEMRLFVGGEKDNERLLGIVEEVVNEVNTLSTSGFQITIVEDTISSNAYLFLGDPQDYIALFPDAEGSLQGNFGYFNVWWNNDIINRARMFVNTVDANEAQQRSLIFEEIIQSLGIGKDSSWYPESIFYETPSNGGFAQNLSEIDREVIRLLYHPRMRIGLTATEVDQLLREILSEELSIA